MAVLQLFKDRAGEFRWRLRADNNQVIASSGEGFRDRSDCERDMKQIMKLAPKARVVDQTKPEAAAQDTN